MLKRAAVFIFVCLSLTVLNQAVAFSSGPSDASGNYLQMDIEDAKAFSNVMQEILGTVTGLENRNAHFYILMDVSGSTKVNEVSNYFGQFYTFLNRSFFNVGDLVTYVPFARHVDESDFDKTFPYAPEKYPIMAAGKQTMELGTDWYEPTYKLLEKIEAESLKDENFIVVLHLSDRTSNDEREPDAPVVQTNYYPPDWDEWVRLQRVLNEDEGTIRFWLDKKNKAENEPREAFYLTVWYGDNIDDFAFNKQVNRERDQGTDVLLAAQERDKEIMFFMQDQPNAEAYNLYLADSKDALLDALDNPGNIDKAHAALFEDIPVTDYENIAGQKYHAIAKSELLKIFPNADTESFYYAIRPVDVTFGESQRRFMREMPPLTPYMEAAPLALVFAAVCFVAALAALFQKVVSTVEFDGKKYVLVSGKSIGIKCSGNASTTNTYMIPNYPTSFEGKTVARLVAGPKYLPPLLQLQAYVLAARDGVALTKPPHRLRNGRNTLTAQSAAGDALDIYIQYGGSVKKNGVKLGLFFILFTIGIILLIVGLTI